MKHWQHQQHLYFGARTLLCLLIGGLSGFFRKRPPETYSGPRLKTTTDAVKKSSVFRNLHTTHAGRSQPVRAAFATSILQCLLTQRILCDFFLTSFPSLLAQHLLWPLPRQSHRQTTTAPKSHQPYVPARSHEGLFERVAASKDNG